MTELSLDQSIPVLKNDTQPTIHFFAINTKISINQNGFENLTEPYVRVSAGSLTNFTAPKLLGQHATLPCPSNLAQNGYLQSVSQLFLPLSVIETTNQTSVWFVSVIATSSFVIWTGGSFLFVIMN